MSLKPLTGLLTAAVVALAATSASAQNVFDPTSWFAPPQRPYYGPNCRPTPAYRTGYPSYAGPVGYGNDYRGNYGNAGNCPDGICGPSNYGSSGYRGNGGNCGNGPCRPRYYAPVAPQPYNGYPTPAPAPIGWNNNPGVSPAPRMPYYDRSITPTNDYDDWNVSQFPGSGRNYAPNNSPFYP